MKILLHIRSNICVPPFYGVCYTYDHLDGALCAPVPLNILIGLYDRARCWLKWGWRRQRLSLAQSYEHGYQEGLRVGRAERRKGERRVEVAETTTTSDGTVLWWDAEMTMWDGSQDDATSIRRDRRRAERRKGERWTR